MDLSKLAVCGELPFEMLEQVFSFLPVPDLCRLRTVSKESNGLICKPEFGATHGHNALRRQDASNFIVMRCTHRSRGTLTAEENEKNTHQKWCFLDLEVRRWYILKDRHPQPDLTAKDVMDGGFICQWKQKAEAQPRYSIIVFNPIADSLREIPSPLAHDIPQWADLNLVVDRAAQQFKIFLLNHRIKVWHGTSIGDVESPLVNIFDSATNEWRSLSNPPGLFSKYKLIKCESFVMFQGLIYVFFGKIREAVRDALDFEIGIWKCSPLENAWEKVNVDPYNSNFDIVDMGSSAFQEVRISAPMLFVSADRLFMMAWITDKQSDEDSDEDSDEERDVPWILKVTEIRASGIAPRRLFTMSKSEVMDVFGVKYDLKKLTHPRILASGCGNSLLFMSMSSGKLVVLDLETLEWELLPQVPMEWEPLPKDRVKAPHPHEIRIFHGKHLNLILPSTLWWQEGKRNAV